MDLKSDLESALEEWQPGKNTWYIPIDVINEKVNLQSVNDILSKAFKEKSHAEILRYSQLIVSDRRKLFALLLYKGLEKECCALVDEAITDEDLPFTRSAFEYGRNDYLLCRKNHEGCPKPSHKFCAINSLRNWTRGRITGFEKDQWMVLAPVFENPPDGSIPIMYLHQNTIMPFIEDQQYTNPSIKREGGFSDVWPVRIHRAHQRLYGVYGPEEHEPLFAVKQLHSQKAEDFEKEYEMLSTIAGHKHVIRLLAAYKLGLHYHLLFAYAKLDLRNYWSKTRPPNWNRATYIWFFTQILGLTSGLAKIHGPNNNGLNVPGARISQLVYGRHGDIKPENILYLDDIGGASREGILQIADMGLSRFHRLHSRSQVDPHNIHGSPTYVPPELELKQKVSRAFDIWSLACLFLEFTTWLVHESCTFDDFATARVKTGLNEYWTDDRFYSVSESNGVKTAEVKPGVLNWIQDLRNQRRCSPLLKEFLDLIQHRMLLVDASTRIRIDDLVLKLQQLLSKGQRNDQDLLGDNDVLLDKEIGVKLPIIPREMTTPSKEDFLHNPSQNQANIKIPGIKVHMEEEEKGA